MLLDSAVLLLSATFRKVIVHSTSSPAKMVWSFQFTKTWISDGMARRVRIEGKGVAKSAPPCGCGGRLEGGTEVLE